MRFDGERVSKLAAAIAFLGVAVLVSTLLARPGDKMAACIGLAENSERLSCYDKALGVEQKTPFADPLPVRRVPTIPVRPSDDR